MFDRSRAHVFVMSPDAGAVLAALDRHFGTWGGRRRPAAPGELSGARGQHVHELFLHRGERWTSLALEDLQGALELGYGLSKRLNVPVVASRAYKYGEWQLKAYHQRDCVLKVGDDPDHELAWVGRPLEADGVSALNTLLGGNATFEAFLKDVVAGTPRPADLERGLGLPALTVGYPDLATSAAAEWEHLAWIQES